MEAVRYIDAVGRAYKAGQIIAIADRIGARMTIRFAKVLALTAYSDPVVPALRIYVPALRIQSYDGPGRLKRPAVMTRLDAAIVLQPIQVPADVQETFDAA